MLSLIICSRNPNILDELKKNIQATIGIEYELIIIDNSKNKYSIFQAYNIGVDRAKYSYLCFMHEDILYHTYGWGKKVIEHFQDEKVSLIGVVGGHYMPKCPASWWSAEYSSGIVIQGKFDDKGLYSTQLVEWLDHKDDLESSVSVVTVDGLWFCIKRELFELVNFDEISFKGFHCYDLDICMQLISLGLDVRVVFNILIEHTSGGNHDYDLFTQKHIWFEKWIDFLPVIKGIQLSKIEIEERFRLVNGINLISNEFWKSRKEIERILNSKAYRLGKFLLKPFSFFRQK